MDHHMSQVHIAENTQGAYSGALWCVCGAKFEGKGSAWAGLWVSLVDAHSTHRLHMADASNAAALASIEPPGGARPPP